METPVSIETKKMIKEARAAGISTRKLAIAVGIDRETLRRWCNGTNPLVDNYERFKQVFAYLMSSK